MRVEGGEGCFGVGDGCARSAAAGRAPSMPSAGWRGAASTHRSDQRHSDTKKQSTRRMSDQRTRRSSRRRTHLQGGAHGGPLVEGLERRLLKLGEKRRQVVGAHELLRAGECHLAGMSASGVFCFQGGSVGRRGRGIGIGSFACRRGAGARFCC